jgi:hypothetical protein
MRLVLAVTLAAALLAPVAALADYFVYCSYGTIVIDNRDPSQYRFVRPSGWCQIGPVFTSPSSAEAFVRNNFGAVGRSCSCT